MQIHDYAFFNKEFVKFEDAKISVMTHAFMYGTAVFEGIRAYWNPEKKKLYALHVREHMERLQNSCKIMRMQPRYSLDEQIEIVINLLKKNAPTADSYVRPSWYKSSLRIGPNLICGHIDNDEDFVVSSIALGDYLDTSKGLSVQVSNWRRISDNAIPARAKVNGSYVNTALSKANAHLAGFDDAIFLTEAGKVSEGSAMNLFLVRDGKLITSDITDNILEGITRRTLIQLAKEELGIEVESRVIDRTELYVCDEAFFAGTGAQIAPITKIDNYKVADAKVGSITQKLQALYNDVCHGKNEKYSHFLTEI